MKIPRVKELIAKLRSVRWLMNASIYTVGNFLQQAAQLFLIPLWARFLTPEDYGISGTANVFTTVLGMVLVLGLTGATTRHYYDYQGDLEKQKTYITSIVGFQTVFSLAVVLILNFSGPYLWSAFRITSFPFDPYIRIVLWTAFARSWIQVPMYMYQAQQKARQYVTLQISTFLLNTLFMAVTVIFLRLGALGQLLSGLFGAGVMLVVLLSLALKHWLVWRFSLQNLREALAYGLPLVPHALATWANNAADRVILDRYINITEMGLYNFGYSLGLSMDALVNAVHFAWTPRYFQLMKNDPLAEKKIERVMLLYIFGMSVICMTGILFVREIMHLLFEERYFAARYFIPPVLVGYFFSGIYRMWGLPLFYHKKTRIIPLLTGISAAFNIGFNLWLVPLYGAQASAWVTSASFALMAALTCVYGQKYQERGYPVWRTVLVAACLVAGAVFIQFQEGLSWAGFGLEVALYLSFIALGVLVFLLPATRISNED